MSGLQRGKPGIDLTVPLRFLAAVVQKHIESVLSTQAHLSSLEYKLDRKADTPP